MHPLSPSNPDDAIALAVRLQMWGIVCAPNEFDWIERAINTHYSQFSSMVYGRDAKRPALMSHPLQRNPPFLIFDSLKAMSAHIRALGLQ